MNPFLNEDFLLSTPAARALYHTYAAQVPIIDYHCHIDPREIACDFKYDNITRVWLGGDHYKWRLLRANGVPERLITGDSGDYEKFLAFAKTLPRAAGNPVYHWAHLELSRYFDCDLILSEDTANEIWNICNEKLQGELSVRNIMQKSNVTGIATTDDPADTLEWHEKLIADPDFPVAVKPAWRPDKLMGIGKSGFGDYLERLGAITDMESLRGVVAKRMDHFHSLGCRASDHGVEALEYRPATEAELNAILTRGIAGTALARDEIFAFQYAILRFMAEEYSRRGWVMEIHYGAARNLNTRLFQSLGPDTGYDAIAHAISVGGLPRLLDELYQSDCLPRTILFSLNPGDNAMLNTLCGCFQVDGRRGWVQQGAAWWFNDTKSGIREQLTSFAETSVLAGFAGMVTDSRSFLSYTRHEYFRRILCGLLGEWMENGEYPDDIERLGGLVQDISYYNAKEYFGF